MRLLRLAVIIRMFRVAKCITITAERMLMAEEARSEARDRSGT